VVRLLQELGLAAEKRPRSGALLAWPGDVGVGGRGFDRLLECKRRRRGFAALYGMLGSAWGLVVRDDRTLVVLRLKDVAALLTAARGNVALAAAHGKGQQLTGGMPQLGAPSAAGRQVAR
jgi:hypothetical protein